MSQGPEPGEVLWRPTAERAAASQLAAFLQAAGVREGRTFAGYHEAWAWSVAHPERFWAAAWDLFDVTSSTPYERVLALPDGAPAMPGARWFPGARLNYAEHALRPYAGLEDAPALICIAETGARHEVSRAELRRQVAAFADWLRAAGVRPGERVVAYLPNIAEAAVAMLATAAVGAVWACCSPDFGAEGTVSRLAQLEPAVLIVGDGYHWNGRAVDRRDVTARLRAALPTVRHVVAVPYVFGPHSKNSDLPRGQVPVHPWASIVPEGGVAGGGAPAYEQAEFSDPLWILFSSGTTGLPKGLVLGQGGIVVEHLKWATLYADLRPGDRLCVYTSTGWVLWNLLMAALLRGATAVLYEGSPAAPDAGRIWEVAAITGSRVMFLGAALVSATQAAGVRPGERYDLSGLDTLMVSGSALPASGYGFVLDAVSPRVRIDSTSGGTDVATGFVGGNELSPVRATEIAGPLLGVAVDAWDDDGRPVVGSVAELVVTQPMPSMPVCLWNDPDGERYRESYFDRWPGVWRHGDWVTRTERGTFVIHGRSDATLNRGGVRLGSAEFYAVLEELPEIREALVVGAELGAADPGGERYHLAVFVVPAEGAAVDDNLRGTIRAAIRARLSPRHLPDAIVEAPGVPHTLTGKRLEVPVKRLLQGVPLERAVNAATVDRPELLDWYAEYGASLAASDR